MANSNSHCRLPVDIVVFYVDGQTPGYRESYEAHCGAIKPCQVRSLGELKYALRSIAKFAPWVNKLFLVVQNENHVPAWLNRDNVVVITHDQFVPEALLPTFQVSTLQGHLHLIPGVAEHFIQWCDDYFLGQLVTPEFFFDQQGHPCNSVYDSPIWDILLYFRSDLYMRSLINTKMVVDEVLATREHFGSRSCFLFPHMPVAVKREWWAEMSADLARHSWFAHTITRKNRNPSSQAFQDVIVDLSFISWVNRVKKQQSSLRNYYLCFRQQLGRALGITAQKMRLPVATVLYRTFKITNDPHQTSKAMKTLAFNPPRFFCINDDAYDYFQAADNFTYHDGFMINPESYLALKSTLTTLFPNKSKYEKG